MVPYTDKPSIENYLGKDIDAAMDNQLTAWIKAMSEYIDSFVGYPLYRDANSERFYDGSGSRSQHIDRVHGTIVVKIGEEVVEPIQTPYNNPVKQGLVFRDRYFPTDLRNISVTGKHSLCAELPEQIAWACTVFVSLIVQQVDEQREGVKSEKIGDYTITFADEAQRTDYDRAKEILKSYRPIAV